MGTQRMTKPTIMSQHTSEETRESEDTVTYNERLDKLTDYLRKNAHMQHQFFRCTRNRDVHVTLKNMMSGWDRPAAPSLETDVSSSISCRPSLELGKGWGTPERASRTSSIRAVRGSTGSITASSPMWDARASKIHVCLPACPQAPKRQCRRLESL